MEKATLIPLSEYLQTSYRPDCDYIDGEVKERTLGTWSHGFMQLFLGALINRNWSLAGPCRHRGSCPRFRNPRPYPGCLCAATF